MKGLNNKIWKIEKSKNRKQKIEKILTLYKKYKTFKETSDLVSKKKLPPFTLDQQIESINPYYIRSDTIKYGWRKSDLPPK